MHTVDDLPPIASPGSYGPSVRVVVLLWLLLCVPWLVPHLASEFAGWRRFRAGTRRPFMRVMDPYEQFLEDVQRSTPTSASVGLVESFLRPPGHRPGTRSLLYPREMKLFTFDDGIGAVRQQVDYLAIASKTPMRAAPGADDIVWIREYPNRYSGTTYGCLLKGGRTGPARDAPNRSLDKSIVHAKPIRAGVGIVLFALFGLGVGFLWSVLLIPGSALNVFERVGLSLLLGTVGSAALCTVPMLLGLGLRVSLCLLLLACVLLYRRAWGAVTDTFRCVVTGLRGGWPKALLAALALGVGRCALFALIPAYGWDCCMIWMFKARVVWIDDGVYGALWHDLASLYCCHPIYPLAWPVTGSIAGVFCGGIGAYVFSWTYQLVVLAGLCCVAGATVRFVGKRAAAWVCVGYAIVPQIWRPKKIGDADMALAVAIFLALTLLAVAFSRRDRRFGMAAWLCAVLAAATKLEGMCFLAAFSAALIVAGVSWSPRWRPCSWRWPDVAPRMWRLGAPLLVLAWYLRPVLCRFPSPRLVDLTWGRLFLNVLRVPEFYGAFLVRLFTLTFPGRLGAVTLAPGLFWELDEVLFRDSAYLYVHVPFLALCLVFLLVAHRVPLRRWTPSFLVLPLLAAVYPWLYVFRPTNLGGSIERLGFHLAAAAMALCLTALARLRESR